MRIRVARIESHSGDADAHASRNGCECKCERQGSQDYVAGFRLPLRRSLLLFPARLPRHDILTSNKLKREIKVTNCVCICASASRPLICDATKQNTWEWLAHHRC